jgi:hypothetical protein
MSHYPLYPARKWLVILNMAVNRQFPDGRRGKGVCLMSDNGYWPTMTAAEAAATVTDDRLLYIVLHRCGHQALFLPDFIERAVADNLCDTTTGQQLLLAISPRL